MALTLRLVVVHAVLSRQRLDEVLQRHVPAHVVAAAQGALDLCSQTKIRIKCMHTYLLVNHTQFKLARIQKLNEDLQTMSLLLPRVRWTCEAKRNTH